MTKIAPLLLIPGLATLIGTSGLLAQPSSPVVVPQRATWTVKINLPDATSSESDASTDSSDKRLLRIESQVDGPMKRDVLIRRNGQKEEVWYRNGLRLTASQNRAFVTSLTGDEGEGATAGVVYSAGFPGTDWILPTHHQGRRKLGKIECDYYQLPEGEAEAWIDPATKLPLRARMQTITYDFAYGPPSGTPLQMPKIFADAWERFETLQRRRAAIRNAVTPSGKAP